MNRLNKKPADIEPADKCAQRGYFKNRPKEVLIDLSFVKTLLKNGLMLYKL